MQCEDVLLHALALSHMPLDAIEREADDTLALNASLDEAVPFDRQDLVAQGLLRWFKNHFFKWVGHA